MAYSDRELLARLIECEAGGEGDNGMRAVASVVMNRVRTTSGEYGRVGNTVRDVVFQPGQFVCAMESVGGDYNPQNIYNMNPTREHYSIADWAIAGNRLTGLGSALWFFVLFPRGVVVGSVPDHLGIRTHQGIFTPALQSLTVRGV